MLHYIDGSPELAEMLIAAGAQIETIDEVIITCTILIRKVSLFLLTSLIHVHN